MKRSVTIAVSLVCGVVCAACVGAYVYEVNADAEAARAEALERYGGEQLEVCVATCDLAPGEVIEESDVEMTLWLADLLPDDAVCDLDEAVGQTVSTTILSGEVISSRRFGEVGSDLEVPEGKVAVSVPAEDVQVVGGAVGAGTLVDMYATGSSTTSLLAEDVYVLATSTGEADEDSDEEVNWITIAVSPELAQSVVAAAQATELYFTIPAEEGGSAEDAEAEDEESSGGLFSGGSLDLLGGSEDEAADEDDGTADEDAAVDGAAAADDGAAASDGTDDSSEEETGEEL